MAQDCTELPSGNAGAWVGWLTECCDTSDMSMEAFFAPWEHAERCLEQMGSGGTAPGPTTPDPCPPGYHRMTDGTCTLSKVVGQGGSPPAANPLAAVPVWVWALGAVVLLRRR